MAIVAFLFLLTGGFPLFVAWQANRATTLRPSLAWAGAAWMGWLLAVGFGSAFIRYLALGLTCCAGVAVLGARRPIAGPWNFVVAGLLAVLLLPAAQGWGTPHLETGTLLFLSATLGVPVINYLPTRLGAGILLAAAGCSAEVVRLCEAGAPQWLDWAAPLCLPAGAWVGWLMWHRSAGRAPFDHLWLCFRDRFGFVWGQPAREQFNHAAANAGWPVILTWRGLLHAGDKGMPSEEELLAVLRSVLKRFGPAEPGERRGP